MENNKNKRYIIIQTWIIILTVLIFYASVNNLVLGESKNDVTLKSFPFVQISENQENSSSLKEDFQQQSIQENSQQLPSEPLVNESIFEKHAEANRSSNLFEDMGENISEFFK